MIATHPRTSARPVQPAKVSSAERVHRYARAVVAREVVTNRDVRAACQRHLDDMATGDARGLRFDPARAAHAIDFFGLLRLAEGDFDGRPFVLEDWQAFIVGSLFGWYAIDADGTWVRRFRNAYVETGKGSGKSPLAAGIGLYGLAADDEAAPEIYSAAAGRDQAGILWTDAKRMVEKSPALLRRITPMAHALVSPSRSGTFRAVSSEARNHHGKRVHVALIDELHAHPDADVLEAMRAGTKGRRNALIFRITNSGFDRQSVCWHDHEYSLRVLDGTLRDDAWFAYVCGLDMCDEHRPSGRPEDGCRGCDQWTDEAVWPKANPNIGVSLPLRYLREMVTEAIGKPSAASTVKRLCFCIWTEGSGKWLDASAFAALGPTGDPPRPRDFGEYRTGYGGLDLASTRDLTALALLSQPDDCSVEGHVSRDGTVRCYDLRAEFWLPEEGMAVRVKRDHVPYDVWAQAGWIHLTPGDVTDYDAIRVRLGELRDDFAFRAIGHDKWNATQLVTDLMNDGFEMYPVDQGMAAINASAKRLESDIAKGLVHHDGNPVLRWMVGNAAAKQDAYGNIKPDRGSSSEKIDGIAAWCDALHVMLAGAGEESSGYESYRELSV